MRASWAAPTMPAVAFVFGTWRVTTSLRASSSSSATSSIPWLAAASAVTYGSLPRTVISSARARSAMAPPILPSPTMPRVLPRSSMPVNALRFHSPRRTDASAAAILRASASIRAMVCSAAAIVLPVGALTTVMPGVRGRVEVDVVDADAGPPDDDQARAGRDHRRVDLDLAAHEERVVLGEDGPVLLRREADPLVDLVMAAEELDARGGERLGDEDLHAGAPAATACRSAGLREDREGGPLSCRDRGAGLDGADRGAGRPPP